MGEMADMALDRAFREEDEYLHYLDGHMSEVEAYDLGIINEYGAIIGNPNSLPIANVDIKKRQQEWAKKNNEVGAGTCPKCGGDTHLVSGSFGEFYGCNDFPSCKGSRNK